MNHINRSPDWLIPGLVGLSLGVVLACLGTISLVRSRSNVIASNVRASQSPTSQPPIATAIPHATSTNTAEPTKTVTPTVSVIPTVFTTPTVSAEYEQLLSEAESKIENGDPAAARKILLSLSDAKADLKTLSRINELLGDTYLSEGLFKMANGYYGTAYSQYCNPHLLYKLSITYSATGNRYRALEVSTQLLNWPGEDADLYRDFARMQIDLLRKMLNLTIPTPDINLTDLPG
jgi:hypothetical protein